jgi:hypothetical protein
MMPYSAEDALALWDSGGDVPAFRVESEGASQDDIYAAAFDMLRGAILAAPVTTLTQRERDAALSIAHVANLKGWAVMVQTHIHPNSPAITVRKPAAGG